MAPSILLLWRFAIAAVALWLLASILGERAMPRRALPTLCALGIACALMSAAYLHVVQRAGVSYAVLLLYTYPIVVAGLERLYRRPLTLARIAALGLASLGVAMLVHAPPGAVTAQIVLVGAFAAVMYGLYIFFGSDALRPLPRLRSAAVITACSAVVFVVPAIKSVGIVSPHTALIAIAAALCGTALPMALLYIGLPKIGAAKASVLGTLEPLTGVALSVADLGEHLRVVQIAGAVLIGVASIL